MTSAKEGKAAPPGPQPGGGAEERLRNPLDQLPPPANSNKPLTPFSIEDILSKPSGRRAAAGRLLDKATGPSGGSPRNGAPAPASPLCALEELATKTFKGLEVNVLQAAEGKGLRRASPQGGREVAGGRLAPLSLIRACLGKAKGAGAPPAALLGAPGARSRRGEKPAGGRERLCGPAGLLFCSGAPGRPGRRAPAERGGLRPAALHRKQEHPGGGPRPPQS